MFLCLGDPSLAMYCSKHGVGVLWSIQPTFYAARFLEFLLAAFIWMSPSCKRYSSAYKVHARGAWSSWRCMWEFKQLFCIWVLETFWIEGGKNYELEWFDLMNFRPSNKTLPYHSVIQIFKTLQLIEKCEWK